VFVLQEGASLDGGLCWEVNIPKTEVRHRWQPGDFVHEPDHMNRILGPELYKQPTMTCPQGALVRLVVSKPQGKGKSLFLVGPSMSRFGKADWYNWLDDTPFMNSSTGHLRVLLAQQKGPITSSVGMEKWRQQLPGVPSDKEICQGIWIPYREGKINEFLWQVACLH
jgi:hypothetical protein